MYLTRRWDYPDGRHAGGRIGVDVVVADFGCTAVLKRGGLGGPAIRQRDICSLSGGWIN